MKENFKYLTKNINIKKGRMKVDDYADAELVHYEPSIMYIGNQEILKINDNGTINFISDELKDTFVSYLNERKITDFLINKNNLDNLNIVDAVNAIAIGNPTIDFKKEKMDALNFIKKIIPQTPKEKHAEKFQEHTDKLVAANRKNIGMLK